MVLRIQTCLIISVPLSYVRSWRFNQLYIDGSVYIKVGVCLLHKRTKYLTIKTRVLLLRRE